MFIPNTSARLRRKAAKRDIHGREIYDQGVTIRLSVVTLSDLVTESSVRVDQGASRGAAEQEVLQAKLLLPPRLAVKMGDVIEVRGRVVEVIGIHQRFDVLGNHDHNEVGGNIKGDL